MHILISGLVNVETSVRVRRFPIDYYPIDYPFFGVESHVAGVAYNIAKALTVLGDKPSLLSYCACDEEGDRIARQLKTDNIQTHLMTDLPQTPVSVVLYDESGRRQIYCDLKNIQEKELKPNDYEQMLENSDIVSACNISFNRSLIRKAKKLGKIVATDVHVLSNVRDEYNRDFLETADILFLSDEGLPCPPETFLNWLKDSYDFSLCVIGLGARGAMMYERNSGKKYHLPAVQTDQVVNTVGAGDALFSAFLHYYAQGMEPVNALEHAQIFAAKKIAFSGASVGFPHATEVEETWEHSEHFIETLCE